MRISNCLSCSLSVHVHWIERRVKSSLVVWTFSLHYVTINRRSLLRVHSHPSCVDTTSGRSLSRITPAEAIFTISGRSFHRRHPYTGCDIIIQVALGSFSPPFFIVSGDSELRTPQQLYAEFCFVSSVSAIYVFNRISLRTQNGELYCRHYGSLSVWYSNNKTVTSAEITNSALPHMNRTLFVCSFSGASPGG